MLAEAAHALLSSLYCLTVVVNTSPVQANAYRPLQGDGVTMTTRDNLPHSAAESDFADESVVVSPGVPTDRVRWGPIMAGAFAALTTLAVLSTLGTAIGLSAYDPGDDARRFVLGAGAWGIISMLIAFAVGGWMTARASAIRGSGNGMLNGFLVGAVTIPIALFFLGTTGAMASREDMSRRHSVANVGTLSDDTQSASATIGGDRVVDRSTSANAAGNANSSVDNKDAALRTARRAAWGSLVGLILALTASAVAGSIGARDDNDHHYRGHSRDTRGHAGHETAL